jgi:hypothetical protein
MKSKFLISLLLLFLTLVCICPNPASAQQAVGLKASVGRYYFSASGIVSPFASVVMTSQNIYLSSAVADSRGGFVMPKALVNDGFDSFCLEATDFRRIGTSYTCFKTNPPKSDFIQSGLFLPPTVGLSGRKIEPNSSILSSGYTMPGSAVRINLGEGLWVDAKADKSGFYKSEIKNVPVGRYELYAAAVYNNKSSGKPTKTFTVESLSLLSGIPFVPLLAISASILVIILFIIVLVKKKKGKSSFHSFSLRGLLSKLKLR